MLLLYFFLFHGAVFSYAAADLPLSVVVEGRERTRELRSDVQGAPP